MKRTLMLRIHITGVKREYRDVGIRLYTCVSDTRRILANPSIVCHTRGTHGEVVFHVGREERCAHGRRLDQTEARHLR